MRMGWYREVQVKQLAAHGDGALLVSRALLVRQRCELENQIRGLMKNFGLRPRATKGRVPDLIRDVRSLAVRCAALRDIVVPLLTAWEAIYRQIAVLTRAVQERTKTSAACRRLMTMPSVGPMTALAFSATVGPRLDRGSRPVPPFGERGGLSRIDAAPLCVWRDRPHGTHLALRRSADAKLSL